MSTRRRSVLGPINEANKIENRQPLKRSARRASMAVTTYNTEKKTARKSINVKSVKPNISTTPTPINITKDIKMKKSLKESGISQKDIHTKVSQPKSILKASIQLNKENDETSFVSGENFDFNKPISTPYLQSPVAGPMTRARKLRRTSVYTRPTTQSTIHQLEAKLNHSTTNYLTATPTKMCNNIHHEKNIKSVKVDHNDTKELETQNGRRTNKARKSILSKTNDMQQLDTKDSGFQDKLNKNVVTPKVVSRRPLLSIISQRVESLNEMKNVAPCTPQPPSDPTVVLKKKMKLKMEAEIKNKVSLMPPSSPYALICDSDDDGTPNECFEKIEERPSRSKAGSFVTATPFPSRNKRRMLDESLSVTSTTSETILEVDKSISKESQPKRNSTQVSLATPKSLHVNAKRHKIENTLKEQLEENEIEQDDDLKKSNQDSADLESQSPSQFPQSHWYTGDLVRACIIM